MTLIFEIVAALAIFFIGIPLAFWLGTAVVMTILYPPIKHRPRVKGTGGPLAAGLRAGGFFVSGVAAAKAALDVAGTRSR
jgi:hypothetical protein